MSMETFDVVGKYRSQWGEGPIWFNDALTYVDIENHKVVRYAPESGVEQEWNVGERVGTVVPRKSGGLVIAGDHGFSYLNEQTGEVAPIIDPEPDKADNRFNDGKCSPDGHFFAGTISLVKKTGDARLYRLGTDEKVTEVFGPVTNSNGIVWSADGATMYYIDTPRGEILAFDYAQGELSNLRTVADTKHIQASPDGMTIDNQGNLWVAFCHGACVAAFDPSSGKEVHRVELPCLETTACAFGGEGLSDLYVTTGVHKSEVEEHAGRLFRVTGLGVSGLESDSFGG